MSTKTILSIFGVVLIAALSFIVFKQHEISQRQEAIEKSTVVQKELADKILRSQSSYATKADIKEFAKTNGTNLSIIKRDLDKLGAEVKSVSNIRVRSIGTTRSRVKSSGTGEANPTPLAPELCVDGTCENPDKFGYLDKEQLLNLDEPFADGAVPFGTAGFSAWQKEPWSIKIHPRTYSVTTVIGEDENQRHYHYSKFSVEVDGKTYEIKLDKAQTKQEYPTADLHWFNPRLSLGLAAGLNLKQMSGEVMPNVGLSFLSYGRYRTQPTFTILTLIGGYDLFKDQLKLAVAPFTYNIGENLPLLNNTYVGPIIATNMDGDISILVGISVGM